MANLQEIIKLVENDNGKVFVVGEDGEVKLVMLKPEEYQQLLLGKLQQGIKDIEDINKEITQAQLSDNIGVEMADLPPNKPARVDLRSEVIDPNFNFDAAPGEEYESIKPEFEDI
jgi:PHD/YefM family antitoxin component YafN of YafNO toxin-antitoxin module